LTCSKRVFRIMTECETMNLRSFISDSKDFGCSKDFVVGH
jgi:hypothetical protein